MRPTPCTQVSIVALWATCFETKSPVTVIHMVQTKYPEDDRLKKLQVHQLVHRFQHTRSVEDNQHSNSGNFKNSLDVVLM